jgi:pilus assembly protein CpaB
MAERRYTVVFYTAILAAGAATYGVYHALQQARAENRVPTRPVVVAAKDVAEGVRIDRLALAVEQWPLAAVPESAFSVIDSVAGRVTRLAVFTGEAIVPGRLAPAGAGPGLEMKIAPGKRAMAVKINDVVGLSGLVQPNSHVDVLVTMKPTKQDAKPVAKLFMSNMRVLSVGAHVERGADGKPINATTATLEVSPDEAERLAIAMNEGSIQLVLRGYGDPATIKTPGATASDVLAQLRNAPLVQPDPKPAPHRVAKRPEPKPTPPPPVVLPPPKPVAIAPKRPDSLVVRVYRGDKMSQQKFEKDTTTKDTTRNRPQS